MPVPSEGLSPQAEWFKYQGQTHTVAMANTALSYPPCSHRFAGNTEEARNPIRGQEWRLEVLPNSSSQEPGTKPSSPSHQQLPTSLLTAPAPAAAMPRSCSLQISFTTVLCKVPGLMLMKKNNKLFLSISLLPAPGLGTLGSLCCCGALGKPQRSREAQAAAAGMTSTGSNLQ